MRSVKLMYLESCTSQSAVLGSRNVFLPSVPNVPKICELLLLPIFVGSKALGFSQLLQGTVTPAQETLLYGLVTTQVSPAPPFPVQSVPRSLPWPVPEISVPCRTVKGR